jgi:hypothetical protein
LSNKDENILEFIKNLENSDISSIGWELVFGKLFDRIGFNIITIPLPKKSEITVIIKEFKKIKIRLFHTEYFNINKFFKSFFGK